MSDRVQRQAEAERAVRRGELKQALALYRELAREVPEDPLIPSRIATIESLLQPDEISVAGCAPTPPASGMSLSRSSTLEQTAELLFERGDLPGAIATYERVLKERPDHDLARERHAELQHLTSLTPASAAAGPRAAPPLPQQKPEMLEALLARIANRRKP
ncbi:MAG TPA: tetratricopeptide repeat protein [Myxococcales bacterium]|jgi:tetratricopeptide (TPR) repeat protein